MKRELKSLCLPCILAMLVMVLASWLLSEASGQCVNGQCPPGSQDCSPGQRWQIPRISRPAVRSPITNVRAIPGVCRIVVQCTFQHGRERGQERCYGTGVLVWRGSQKAVVLTVHHLFPNGRIKWDWVEVIFPNGEKYKAERVETEAGPDLGIIIIPRPDVEPVPICIEDHPKSGERVRMCGYDGLTGAYGEMAGIVAGYRQTGEGKYQNLTVTGAARDGDSGGPILNASGEIVAILWGTDGTHTLGAFNGRICQFLQTQRYALPWNADIERERIRAEGRVAHPLVPVAPIVPVIPPVITGLIIDATARQMAQDALDQVAALSGEVDAVHNTAVAANNTATSSYNRSESIEKGLAERIFSGAKAYTFGLLKAWGLPGGFVLTGIIGIGFFFVRKKLNRVAQIIDWITDKIPGQWDDKLIDPMIYKAASLVSGRPIPEYANTPGMDPWGKPYPGYEPPPSVVTPPTAKELVLQAQIDALNDALKAKG